MRGLIAVLTAAMIGLTGCAMLPAAGPSTSAVLRGGSTVGQAKASDYLIVDIDERIAGILTSFKYEVFPTSFGTAAHHPPHTIGVGDVLGVSIFEAGEGGLFSTNEVKRTDLKVTVNDGGTISIPYAGRINVAGHTPEDVQDMIRERLKDRAIQPDVLVQVVDNESNTVTVSGAVAKPGRYPISIRGDRVLDVIALAGGSTNPAYETYVTMTRGSVQARVPLQEMLNDQSENVYVRPGDQIFLVHEPQTFTAFGALRQPGEHPFGAQKLSLIETVAKAGGLNEALADPTGIFLFRYEPKEIVKAIRPDYDGHLGYPVPVVYRLNMKDPRTYFFAQVFPTRDKDVFYVATAPGAELSKFLQILQGIRFGTLIARDIHDISD